MRVGITFKGGAAMNKALEYLVLGILTYYLLKGVLYIFMWQGLVTLEARGKQKKAKQREQRLEDIRRKREIRENTCFNA